MRLLLDTHAFLWWVTDDARLSREAREAIGRSDAMVHVSVASIWEIAIKEQLRRIDLQGADVITEVNDNGFLPLPITLEHARTAGALPTHHGDPFDRMRVAQTRLEGLTLVSRDSALARYQVPLLVT